MFTCSLVVDVPVEPELLLNHFAQDSIVPIVKGAADSVYKEGPEQFVSLFNAFGYEATARIFRRVDFDAREVNITIRSFERNWKSVPKVVKGGAQYRFESIESGCRFHYTQTVKVDRTLNAVQRFLVRWQLQPIGKQLERELEQFFEES